MAGNHEINNVQEEISTAKWSGDTMGEARRETERVWRMRRRERQRANRRRSGRPAKAGKEMIGAGEVLGAISRCHESMEAQAIMIGKMVAAQDTLGAQTTNIVGAMEQRIAAVEAGMRVIRAVQAADASQTDEIGRAHV